MKFPEYAIASPVRRSSRCLATLIENIITSSTYVSTPDSRHNCLITMTHTCVHWHWWREKSAVTHVL